MAWFWRGAQSAFFYYVSCAPCSNARFQHRRAKEKARVEKATKKALLQNASRGGDLAAGEQLHGDDHELLTGVGAFTTNIYWQGEIELGPNFKKGMRPRQDTAVDRRDNKRGRGSKRQASGKRSAQQSRDAAASLDTLRTDDSAGDTPRVLSTASGNQQVKTQQRPDEALWGNPFPEKDWSFYARGRNPSINSLTPPVVSTLPATAEEASWMLQPPPPAKVMEGKQAPVQRSSSIGAASKVSIISKMSKKSGGTRFSELKRPEKAIIADLGENMCSMTEKPVRRAMWRISRADGTADGSRPTTPETGHQRQDSAFSSFDSPSRNIARLNRPAPIETSIESDTESGRDAYGFAKSWIFPKRGGQDFASPSEPMSAGSSNMDGLYYHSEPEPDLAYSHGIAYQDFAHRQQALVRSTTVESEAPYHTPKSKATTRAGSNSPSPRTLSPDSSSSSLHVLKDVLAPAVITRADKQHEAVEALPHMEGITEDELENIIPRYTSGPREVRLGSGTQV